jgi:putative intracellular protease/amidase
MNLKTKIVLVATSANELQGHATGLWLEELAAPYYIFRAKGYQVLIASIGGGEIPIDASSLKGDFFTEPSQRFMEDPQAQEKLLQSLSLKELNIAKDQSIDAIFLTGGHGVCVDYPRSKELKDAIESLLGRGKVVAAVCHGVVGLVPCMTNGSPLVDGRTVTGFSNSEEDAVQLSDKVPFLLEGKLKELGAKYERAENDWTPHVCIDGTLITGQNPQSSEACAKAVVQLLG